MRELIPWAQPRAWPIGLSHCHYSPCEHERSLMMETSSHSSWHPRHLGQCLITRGCSVTPLHAQMKLVLQAGEFPRRESWTLTGHEKSKPRSSSSLHSQREKIGGQHLACPHAWGNRQLNVTCQAGCLHLPTDPCPGEKSSRAPLSPVGKVVTGETCCSAWES